MLASGARLEADFRPFRPRGNGSGEHAPLVLLQRQQQRLATCPLGTGAATTAATSEMFHHLEQLVPHAQIGRCV